ncbi:hypothetical protein K440DRAFT_165364 [Wilcoxina mikolae CBS 423.85]|nr:hypothetical protein K440DRAFT_165364 [Wilcoxina mikolae CBS 423.85]
MCRIYFVVPDNFSPLPSIQLFSLLFRLWCGGDSKPNTGAARHPSIEWSNQNICPGIGPLANNLRKRTFPATGEIFRCSFAVGFFPSTTTTTFLPPPPTPSPLRVVSYPPPLAKAGIFPPPSRRREATVYLIFAFGLFFFSAIRQTVGRTVILHHTFLSNHTGETYLPAGCLAPLLLDLFTILHFPPPSCNYPAKAVRPASDLCTVSSYVVPFSPRSTPE